MTRIDLKLINLTPFIDASDPLKCIILWIGTSARLQSLQRQHETMLATHSSERHNFTQNVETLTRQVAQQNDQVLASLKLKTQYEEAAEKVHTLQAELDAVCDEIPSSQPIIDP